MKILSAFLEPIKSLKLSKDLNGREVKNSAIIFLGKNLSFFTSSSSIRFKECINFSSGLFDRGTL